MFRAINHTFLIALMVFSVRGLFAQKIQLQVFGLDSIDRLKYKSYHTDTLYIQEEIGQLTFKLRDKGYLEANVDSIERDSQIYRVHYHLGNQYRWFQLKTDAKDRWLFEHHLLKEKHYLGKPISIEDWTAFQERVIQHLENTGFPFAEIHLDSIQLEENVSAKIVVNKYRHIKIDSIEVKGKTRLGKEYLYHYLNIYPKSSYNESSIQNIDESIQMLSFLDMTAPKEIIFQKDKAIIRLYLQDNPVSSFNAIVGVVPDDEAQTSGRFLMTGDVRMYIENPWGAGRRLSLNWRRLSPEVEDLDAGINNPYIFNSSVGLDYQFSLFRNKEDFLSRSQRLAVQYLFKGMNYVEGFLQFDQSKIMKINRDFIRQYKVLPRNQDMEVYYYGLGWNQQQYDYRFNPLKGYGVNASFAIGQKEIKENSVIRNLMDSIYPNKTFNVYDTVQLKANSYKMEYSIEHYTRLGKAWALKVKSFGGSVFSENLLGNELFLIGGLKSLRGFNEGSMLASTYAVLTLESKWLLDKDSYFYVFTDMAYRENIVLEDINGKPDRDTPNAIGLGMNFRTKAGVFALSYAVGKEYNNPFYIRNAKVHLGYINYF